MRAFIYLSLLTGACLTAALSSQNVGKMGPAERAMAKANKPTRRDFQPLASHPAPLQKRASPYLNNKTSKFVVDGTAFPDVNFDIGESYAGLLPISSAANETRELFFWFFPSENPDASDEITIWLNGGPGCSSLTGLLQENGPFLYQSGTFAPVKNPYTWVNLTNMLWIEQPIGVGYTQGKPDIADEIGLSKQFMGFYKNFVDAFDLQKREVYLTGESYAGFYVPYIANAFLNSNDTTYYNLAGTLIIDPIIGDGSLQQEVPAVAFMNYWENEYSFNSSFLASIRNRADVCNYTSYLNDYLTYPPPGAFPPSPDYYVEGCDVFDDIYAAALLVNPCYNVYHITDQCPFTFDPLGVIANGFEPPGATVYFNRSDVQALLHVPPTNWMECTNKNVFPGGGREGDESLGPAQDGVLQNVIEKTNNVIIAVGNQDGLLYVNGTLLVIQNMTWNGLQGLQHAPTTGLYVPYHEDPNLGALSGAGIAGYFETERGLTYATISLAGHMIPEFAPGAAYRMVEFLLGRISGLDQTGDFTTQSGNFTGTTPLLRKS